MFTLTAKQQIVMDFLVRHHEEHRRAPLLREIQNGCGIASYKSVLDRLNALERKGLIKRLPHKHRGIKIMRRSLNGAAQPATLQPVAEEAT